MTMEDLLAEATRIRAEAKKSEFWKLNMEALLESNNELFEGPIAYDDIEACYNYVLDLYDPNVLLKNGGLIHGEYQSYVESSGDGNPFFSLIQLDGNRNVEDVILWETDDVEAVGEFLSKKYKWKK
jgi:hypothetical protein